MAVPSYSVLHEGTLISVHEFSCAAPLGGPGPEEESGIHSIVLLRRGAFTRHLGGRSATADVNQVSFFSGTDTYRVSHPGHRGDRGTVLVPSPRLLAELYAEGGLGHDPAARFPFASGPSAPDLFWRAHRLADRPHVDPLWTEEVAAGLAADAIHAAAKASGGPGPRRSRTIRRHADLVEGMKAYLAAHLGDRVTLDDVARAVYASPFHGARRFREITGLPLHRYLTRLRLRASLDSLRQGGEDLATLALRLGFASHAHFTEAFRREFGRPPSTLRGTSSKNSKARREPVAR